MTIKITIEKDSAAAKAYKAFMKQKHDLQKQLKQEKANEDAQEKPKKTESW